MIEVIKQGLLTTVQDLGRPGYFHLGIPLSGAMDQFALRVVNLLVGNDENAAGLEAVFMGPELRFKKDTIVAVTGADIPVKIDGKEYSTYQALEIKAGETLSFGNMRSGARIYIAVAGGIGVPQYLGSRSTYLIGSLGGIEGKAISNNDLLPIGSDLVKSVEAGTTLPEKYLPSKIVSVKLRVLPGLYWHRITPESQKRFFKDEWKVALEIDRMGYRFKGGEKLDFVERKQPFGAGSDPSNIVDSCYSYGSIQVPGGLEPIILHRDAVSGGGYFTLGAIISADMDIIGQLQPNITTKFVKVDMEEALNARQARIQKLNEVRAILK